MHTLSVPGTLDSLGAIRAFIKTVVAEAGIDRKRGYRLQLSVDEIATNIATHGYAEGGMEGKIELRSWVTNETLIVTIEDTSRPFNPLEHAIPAPARDGSPEQRQTGGLGVYLAIRSVDSFLYERDGDRNRNILVVNRTGKAGEPGAPIPRPA